jgi:hypothetical protein
MTEGLRREKPRRPKKAYRSPSLVRYGRVRDVTAGGSGNANENAQGIGLDPDSHKKRP